MVRFLRRAAAVLILAHAVPALAGPPDVATAQALFDAALSAMEKKDYQTACPKLEEAEKMLPDALGVKEQLALCVESQGRLATALSRWLVLEDLAGRAGQAERQRTAVQHAADVKQRAPRLSIRIEPAVAAISGLVVKRDGSEVAKALWDTEVPMDNGSHEVSVEAPGHAPFRQKVDLVEKAKVVVDVRSLTASDAPGAPAGAEQASSPGTWQRPASFAAMGVGGAGVVVGAILGGLAIAKKDQSNAGPCNAQNLCTQEGVDLRKDARGLGNASTAAFIAGGVLVAGGITLLVLAPSSAKNKTDTALAVRASAGGLTVSGRF